MNHECSECIRKTFENENYFLRNDFPPNFVFDEDMENSIMNKIEQDYVSINRFKSKLNIINRPVGKYRVVSHLINSNINENKFVAIKKKYPFEKSTFFKKEDIEFGTKKRKITDHAAALTYYLFKRINLCYYNNIIGYSHNMFHSVEIEKDHIVLKVTSNRIVYEVKLYNLEHILLKVN